MDLHESRWCLAGNPFASSLARYEPPKGKSPCAENISEVGSMLKYILQNISGSAKDLADYPTNFCRSLNYSKVSVNI